MKKYLAVAIASLFIPSYAYSGECHSKQNIRKDYQGYISWSGRVKGHEGEHCWFIPKDSHGDATTTDNAKKHPTRISKRDLNQRVVRFDEEHKDDPNYILSKVKTKEDALNWMFTRPQK